MVPHDFTEVLNRLNADLDALVTLDEVSDPGADAVRAERRRQRS